MRRYAKFVLDLARRIHKNEQGAEALEKLLIIALIVVPLMVLLFSLKGVVTQYVTNAWTSIDTENSTPATTVN